ncbi:MAG: DUF721 domain-containing protein [Nitrospinae bacterium]|nr:DUF721 domain-containing protein [Nitrospinota bacterium]
MISIKDALGEALKSVHLGAVAKLAAINSDWERIVGPQLAGVCRPAYIWQKTLIIHVFDPAFMTPLEFSRVQILEKVQNQLGDRQTVQTVSIRLGDRESIQKHHETQKALDAAPAPEVEKAVEEAKSPELKEALSRLFTKGLSGGRKTVFVIAAIALAACATPGKGVPQKEAAKPAAEKAETDAEITKRMERSRLAYYHYLRAQMYIQENRLGDALDDLKVLLKSDPYSADVYLDVSRISLSMGRYTDAIDAALGGLAVDPEHPYLNAFLGGIYYNAKNFPRAEVYLEKALELDPRRMDVRLNLAMCHVEQKKLDEAEKEFLAVFNEDPESLIALVFLARVYVEKQQFVKAEEFLTQFIQKNPTAQKGYETLGWVYGIQKKYELAADIYKKYLEIEPDNEEIQQKLANTYLLMKNYGEALDVYKGLEKTAPDTSELAMRMGILYFQRKEYQPALEKFQLVRLKDPASHSVTYYIARIYEEMGMLDEAAKEWEAMAEAESVTDKAEIYVRIGGIRERQGKFAETEAYLRKAIEGKKDDAELYYMLSVILVKQEKFPQAVESLKKAIELEPERAEYPFYLGATYEKMKEYDKSVEAMKRTLEINPKHADALNYISYLYADRNMKLDEALGYVKQALEMEPANGFYLDTLAWVYFRQDKLPLALETILKAIENTKEKDATVYGHLGDIHAAMGSWAKAGDAYGVSVGVKDDPEMKQKLQQALTKAAEAASPAKPKAEAKDAPSKSGK